MELWVGCVAMLLVTGCAAGMMGPTEEQLDCYRNCGRDKDACMLYAKTAGDIGDCDARSSQCSEACQ